MKSEYLFWVFLVGVGYFLRVYVEQFIGFIVICIQKARFNRDEAKKRQTRKVLFETFLSSLSRKPTQT